MPERAAHTNTLLEQNPNRNDIASNSERNVSSLNFNQTTEIYNHNATFRAHK
jgi:hypothetical protein